MGRATTMTKAEIETQRLKHMAKNAPAEYLTKKDYQYVLKWLSKAEMHARNEQWGACYYCANKAAQRALILFKDETIDWIKKGMKEE